jgi:hypothetical protein
MSLCLVIRPAILGAIGLLDRLSRNLAFIATLMDSGTKFVAVDNPHANRLITRAQISDGNPFDSPLRGL